MKNTAKAFIRATAICLVLLCAMAVTSCSRARVYGETLTPTAAPEQAPATEEKAAEPAETEEPAANTERVTMTAGGLTLSLELPEGWTSADGTDLANFDEAISFFPEENENKKITVMLIPGPHGVCGTCLVEEKISVAGVDCLKLIYTDIPEEPWDRILFGGVSRDGENVVIVNRGFDNEDWAIYGDRVMAILDTITVG